MEIRFDGQRVLVTGAAQGNGKAIAAGFADSGADVIIVDRNAERLEQAADELRRASGRRIWAHAVDIADRAACRALAATVERDAGPIDHLVNNAGIDGRAPLGTEGADEVWDAVINVNLNGLYNMTSSFVAQIIARKGTILNLGSTMSFVGQPRMIAYTSSKAAIVNFTQTLSIELAPHGVRVNCLAPGLFQTSLTAGLFQDPERLNAMLARTCLGRAGEPQELVGPALMMCSAQASYMTGATVRVDGGWLAR
ncbi:MAG: SDR family NAD(P)-dependent oxidoreductase [Burkholderiaceae bacterium]